MRRLWRYLRGLDIYDERFNYSIITADAYAYLASLPFDSRYASGGPK